MNIMLERSRLNGRIIEVSGAGGTPPMDPRIALVLARIDDALDQPHTLAELAGIVNLSPSRLAHLFTEEVGTPPARYLHERRLARARLLLERTFLTVRQVMTAVGIHDPSHFARDFRRLHGVGPSQLRQQSWPGERSRRPPPTDTRISQPT
jgi:AraC family transcriptional regulator, arabinose operon regulatory protein